MKNSTKKIYAWGCMAALAAWPSFGGPRDYFMAPAAIESGGFQNQEERDLSVAPLPGQSVSRSGLQRGFQPPVSPASPPAVQPNVPVTVAALMQEGVSPAQLTAVSQMSFPGQFQSIMTDLKAGQIKDGITALASAGLPPSAVNIRAVAVLRELGMPVGDSAAIKGAAVLVRLKITASQATGQDLLMAAAKGVIHMGQTPTQRNAIVESIRKSAPREAPANANR